MVADLLLSVMRSTRKKQAAWIFLPSVSLRTRGTWGRCEEVGKEGIDIERRGGRAVQEVVPHNATEIAVESFASGGLIRQPKSASSWLPS